MTEIENYVKYLENLVVLQDNQLHSKNIITKSYDDTDKHIVKLLHMEHRLDRIAKLLQDKEQAEYQTINVEETKPRLYKKDLTIDKGRVFLNDL